ncbi:lytic murein transglycosylase [Hyphobacterium marinum]|uniref:Lytic murein transglycosylase n=1 Tax=Hyphobacterium marinum TaxID=3116574 RepID=A0ABU7LY76_9PROT|nr:lytic murein transglycosylase [Hyphobacterium sp. Y6023]MEE2566513.1 lytic murein transglycosylase [Hyphobacterium sp. Y6023]
MMRVFLSGVTALLLSACATAQDGPFNDWLNDFRPRLAQAGASPQTVDAMLDGLEPDLAIIERDRDQPEFVRPLWEYLDIAASDQRTTNGMSAFGENRQTLLAIEERFGVDAEILVAIWGLESSYGAIMGSNDVVQALATLAWEGRRRSWAEAQLIAVGQMLDRGFAYREQLTGSWAGAMGQTQFIPETYLARAVDFDGDGTRNIWTDNGDALASSANLLARAGWTLDAPIALEVAVPQDYDLSNWAPNQSRLVAEWAASGITRADGREWSNDEQVRAARLILPAGLRGPGFLTFANFEAIKRYNNSTSYALGVWLLSLRVGGGGEIVQGWPTDDPPITRSQTRELQEALLAMGHDPGGVDGIFGPNSRRALMAFQRSRGMIADGYAGRLTYDAVMAAN